MAFALREGVSLAEAEDGTVLLDEHSGKYWQLNKSGSLVLRRMLDGEQPRQIASLLAARFNTDVDRAARDVDAVIVQLSTANLVST